MIDLHAHILPGLDDGAKTLQESIQMCQISYRDGVRVMVATPHTLNGLYLNDREKILNKVQELNEAILKFGIQNKNPEMVLDPNLPTLNSELTLRVLPGADVHFSEKTLLHLDQGELMTINDGKKYLFIEFPYQGIPYHAEEVLFELMTRGVIPIITHPERNLEVGQRPQRYYELIRMGCLGQVTAMSLTGEFGSKVRQLSERLLKYRLLHFIASDTHSMEGRSPILSTGVKAAAKVVGKEEARKMATEYPQAILEGRRPNVPEPVPL